MKVSNRLYIGFGGIIVALLGLFILSHFSLEQMERNQKTLQTSSHFYNEIAKADSTIEKMQRYIILYANTGMKSVYDSVISLSTELNGELKIIKGLSAVEQERQIVANMEESLRLLTEQFERASEDRSDRDALLNGDAIALSDTIEGQFLTLRNTGTLGGELSQQLAMIELSINKSQQAMLLYVTTPNASRSKESRRQLISAVNSLNEILPKLSQEQSTIVLAIIKNTRDYRKQQAKIFRLTRGYLFIFNGVIAGQAAEFSRSSQELKDLSLSQRETLFSIVSQTISDYSVTSTIATSLSVILGLFFAWYTARGIIEPINKITSTFIALSKGQNVKKIPGLDSHNEIGDMAKSAQVFKEKNQQTEDLLIEAKHTQQVLEDNKEELKRHQENLEEMVSQRTQELEESIVTLKKTQTQLAKSERMASIGNMVQGVSHELNTPVGLALTAVTHIHGDGQALANDLANGKLTKDALSEFLDSTLTLTDSMSTSLEKAAQLIKSFKLVSVNEHQEHLQHFNMRDHLDNLLASMRRSIDRRFTIENKIDTDVLIDSYPGVFYQIYTNLMNNSVLHGFEGRDSGLITIDASVQNDELVVTYSDDGVGMDEATQANLYEAFFTTKRARGGTGLGMNIVQALVTDKLHGDIELFSTIGEGTTYRLIIPLKQQSAAIVADDAMINM